MRIKIKELSKISGSIVTLINSPLSPNIGLRLRKFTKAFTEAIDDYNEARNALVKKYGVPKGDTYEIPNDDREAISKFKEENDLLLEEEVELPDITLKTSEITPMYNSRGDLARGAILTPIDLNNLEFLFEDLKEEETVKKKLNEIPILKDRFAEAD